jgi:hypothetical protein
VTRAGWWLLARAAATALAFGSLLAFYDFDDLRARLAATHPAAFLGAIALLAACITGMAAKWHLALREARFGVLLRALVASFFYALLPSGQMGGEVGKMLVVKARQPQVRRVASSIVFDKVTGLFGLSLVGLVALACTGGAPAWQWTVAGSIAAACVTGLYGCAAIARLARAVPVRHRMLLRVRDTIGGIAAQIAEYAVDHALVAKSTLLALATQGLVVAMYVLLARDLGLVLSTASLVAAVVIANLATLVPISLAGLGVREAGLVVLLVQHPGVESDRALGLSLVAMAVLLVAAAAGACLEARHAIATATQLRSPQ